MDLQAYHPLVKVPTIAPNPELTQLNAELLELARCESELLPSAEPTWASPHAAAGWSGPYMRREETGVLALSVKTHLVPDRLPPSS